MNTNPLELLDQGSVGSSDPRDVAVWQTVRSNIVTFNTIVITLLTQASALMFGGFALIGIHSEKLGNLLVRSLTTGISVGVLMLTLCAWRFAHSVDVGVGSAKWIEDRMFPDREDRRRFAHRLSGHWCAGGKLARVWSSLLLAASLWISALLWLRLA